MVYWRRTVGGARAVAYGREALSSMDSDARVRCGTAAPPVPSSAPPSDGGLELSGAEHCDPAVAFGGHEREPPASPRVASPDPGTIARVEPLPPPAARKWSWPDLMRHTFELDVLASIRCGGHMRIVATIEDPVVIRKILTHLGLPTAVPSPRPPPADLFGWS
jgi:hypothetical protein